LFADSCEYGELVEAIAMELRDTASHYIKAVTTSTCVTSAFNDADVIVLHDDDVQVNESSRKIYYEAIPRGPHALAHCCHMGTAINHPVP